MIAADRRDALRAMGLDAEQIAEVESFLADVPFPKCPVDRSDCTSGPVCCMALGGKLEHLAEEERETLLASLYVALADNGISDDARRTLRKLARKFEGTDKKVFVRHG